MGKNKTKQRVEIGNYDSHSTPISTPAGNEDQLSRQRWSVLFFYGSYGLFYVIAMVYRQFLPTISIPFHIPEQNVDVQFNMQLAEIMDIIMLGIWFSVNGFQAFELIYASSPKRNKRSKFYFMIAVIILNFGVIVHTTANNFHEYIYLLEEEGTIITPGSTLDALKTGLYFWDEIASHIFTGLGLFFLMSINISNEARNPNTVPMKSKSLDIIGFLTGIGIAFGLIEGQAGVIFFGFSVLMLLYLPIRLKINKQTLETKPFNRTSIFIFLGYILFTVLWAIITGIKADYPFLYQISEIWSVF